MDLHHRTFLEAVAETLMGVVFAICTFIWWIISSIAKGIWAFIKAIFSNVYGRVVVALGGLLYLFLAGYFTSLLLHIGK